MSFWRIGLFFLAISGVWSAYARGQGLTSADIDAIRALPRWEPEPQGYSENSVVDLRRKMPPVGEQKMNDCAAWAFGYAAKSYVESIDQDWTADSPRRIFSPRFIYNQLNRGKDTGASGLAVMMLLQEKGCATLASCPYVPDDFRGQPTSAAFTEAENFKIASFYVVDNKDSIRRALIQGHVVPIGTTTTPVFMGGRWDIYTKALHQRGLALKRRDQPHGKHALCIVGYDDTKEAFLVMNSWGKDWNKAGYCWIAYELFAHVSGAQEAGEFFDWGAVIVDERSKVEIGPGGKYAIAINKESIRPIGTADYRGFDAATRKHRFFYTAEIGGAKATLAAVERVVWTANAGTDEAKDATALPEQPGFRVSGLTSRRDFVVKGTVYFKDKTTKGVQVEYALPAPSADRREVAIAFKDDYYGRDSKAANAPLWTWEARLTGNLMDLADITEVIWDAPQMSPNDRAHKQAGGQPKAAFLFEGTSSDAGAVTAKVTFNDGSVKSLVLPAVFRSPVNDELQLHSEYREEEVEDGRTFYHFTVTLQAPMQDVLFKIAKVEYDYGPTFDHFKFPASWATFNFATSGTTQREFLMKAKVYYTDGPTKEVSRWIELGKPAKYADPFRIEMQSLDRYAGLLNGKPMWNAIIRPNGDPATLERIDKVVYELPPEISADKEITVAAAQSSDFRLEKAVDKDFRGSAKVMFKDGNYTKLPIVGTLRSPRMDFLDLGVSAVTRKLGDDAPRLYWEAAPEGPDALRRRVISMDMEYRRYGVRHVLAIKPAALGFSQALVARDYADAPIPMLLHTVLELNDGSRVPITGRVGPNEQAWDGPAEKLGISLREKFWGIEEGRPVWTVSADISGPPAMLANVRRVTFVRTSDLQAFSPAAGQGLHVEMRLSRPDEIAAHVNVREQENEVVIRARTTGLAGRTTEPLVLRQSNVFSQPPNKSGQNWMVWLDGWENDLRNVKQVVYTLPPMVAKTPITVAARDQGDDSGFALRGASGEPVFVEAAIVMRDGSSRKLSVQTGLPAAGLDWTYDTLYYGADQQGADQWLLNFHLIGSDAERLAVTEVVYRSKSMTSHLFRGTTRWYAGPAFDQQAVAWKPFSLDEVVLRYPGAEFKKLRGGKISLKAEKTPTLSVQHAPGMVWPGQKPEQAEWVFHLAGPERDMERLEQVTWQVGNDPDTRQIVVRRRGEKYDGFECRYVGREAPTAAATLRRSDGSIMRISGE